MKRGGYREKLLLAIDGSARSMKAAEQVNAILKHGWNRGTSKKAHYDINAYETIKL